MIKITDKLSIRFECMSFLKKVMWYEVWWSTDSFWVLIDNKGMCSYAIYICVLPVKWYENMFDK